MMRSLVIVLVMIIYVGNAFRLGRISSRIQLKTYQPKQLNAVADYAAEVQNAVGPEIYAPIFKAGLFLIFGGIFSAVITGFLISVGGSADELVEEFDQGTASQFAQIPEKQPKTEYVEAADTATDNASNSEGENNKETNKVMSELKSIDL